MARKPKITPTFADNYLNGNGMAQQAVASPYAMPPHIIPQHEPLRSESQPAAMQQAEPVVVVPPVTPVAEPLPLKVALIGTAPSSRHLAPFHDTSWQIWSCSPGNMNAIPRADLWFELHQNLHWPENQSYGGPYIEWLRKLTIPVFMQDQTYVPNALTFPKDEMVKEFGRDFFTSSFAWMMAFAIHKGAKEIALFGIDMASRDEYILQRPGFYFFKHLAEQRGIKVSAPNESDIMMSPGLYGYSEVTPFGRKILARTTEIKQRLDGLRIERDKLNHNITYLEGASEDLDYVHTIWGGVSNNT